VDMSDDGKVSPAPLTIITDRSSKGEITEPSPLSPAQLIRTDRSTRLDSTAMVEGSDDSGGVSRGTGRKIASKVFLPGSRQSSRQGKVAPSQSSKGQKETATKTDAPARKKKAKGLSLTSRLRGAVQDGRKSPAQRIKSDRCARTWQESDLRAFSDKLDEEDNMGSTAWNLEALDDIDAMLAAADATQQVLEKEAVIMRRKGNKAKEEPGPKKVKEKRAKKEPPAPEEAVPRTQSSLDGARRKKPDTMPARILSVQSNLGGRDKQGYDRGGGRSPPRRPSPTAFQKLAAMGGDLQSDSIPGSAPEDVTLGEARGRWWGPAGPMKGVLVCIAADSSGSMGGPCSEEEGPPNLRRGLYDSLASTLPGSHGIAVLQLGCSRRGAGHAEESTVEAQAAVDWCRKNAPGKAICLIGHAVAAGVALQATLGCRKHVKGLCVLSCPGEGLPNVDGLKKLRGEFLVATGSNDHIARPSVAQQIFAACPKPKQLRLYHNATHELHEVRGELTQDVCEWATRAFN